MTAGPVVLAGNPGAVDAAKDLENSLDRTLAAMVPQGVVAGCRLIQVNDERHLTATEAQSIRASKLPSRSASGAARFVVHGLLEKMGIENVSIPRSIDGSPVWPTSIIGSMAHDDLIAVAAVAPAARYSALGIDIEPAEPLPAEVEGLVQTEADVEGAADLHLFSRLLFSAKEAVYKAVYPLHKQILGYEDIAVDLRQRRAVTNIGDSLRIAFCLSPRIVVLAFREDRGSSEC